MEEALTFDDVLIVPQYSEVESRLDPDTSTCFDMSVPLISANMDTVTGVDMAVAIGQAGGMGVLHRFMMQDELVASVAAVKEAGVTTAVSLGIGDPGKFVDWCGELVDAGADVLVLDVAHAHQKRVIDCLHAWLDSGIPGQMIAGNVATTEGAKALIMNGADWAKVGIGPGAACTTRTVTGVGYPQFSAIQNAAGYRIIADGGIKSTADFVKAVAAGADAVMCGSLFAGCDESPGEIIETPEGLRKTYRGSSSAEAREEFGLSDRIAEGKTGTVPYTGPVAHTVEQYQHALQSAMSYVGASDLNEFRAKAQFVKQTPASVYESGARI